MRIVLGLVVAAAAGCAAAEWKAADEALARAAGPARAAGFVPLAGRNNDFGTFTDSGSYAWTIELRRGQRIVVGAACAVTCGALGFDIAGPDGWAAADTSTGNAPFLELVAPDSGEYRITMRHGTCADRRCRWVAQVYGLPGR
jgi:hypothetical protein